MFILFFFVNLLFLIISTKAFYIFYKERYVYPFRLAELKSFILNLLIFVPCSYYYFGPFICINVVIINFCLFYCLYSINNMINTSPRTKIMLLIFKNKSISYRNLTKKYNIKDILDNRLKRFITNKEIRIVNKNIYLQEKNISFLKVVINIFKLIKKI